MTNEVGFRARIKYCFAEDNDYITGAEIEEVSDEVWFRIFKKVHDFIAEKAYFAVTG